MYQSSEIAFRTLTHMAGDAARPHPVGGFGSGRMCGMRRPDAFAQHTGRPQRGVLGRKPKLRRDLRAGLNP